MFLLEEIAHEKKIQMKFLLHLQHMFLKVYIQTQKQAKKILQDSRILYLKQFVRTGGNVIFELWSKNFKCISEENLTSPKLLMAFA